MLSGRCVIAAILASVVCGATVQCASPTPTETPPDTARPAATPHTTALPAPPPAVRVDDVDAAQLGTTWQPGCPVTPQELRALHLPYIGMDGQSRTGVMVVHRDVADDVVAIFDDLYRMRYPIDKMRTVDEYPGADDELSMADNNTSAFNCRRLPSGRWSLHARGRAIDINPLLNPYVEPSGAFQPANAGPFLDRGRTDPGMLRDGDPAVQAFLGRGWRWGGHWRNPIDYQHFERR